VSKEKVMVHTVDVEKSALDDSFASPTKRKVGDKIWAVPYRGEPHEVEIIKVGRKWAKVIYEGYERSIDLKTLQINFDDPSSPYANFFETREAWVVAVERDRLERAWRELREAMPWIVPAGVTLAWIEAARRLFDGGEAVQRNAVNPNGMNTNPSEPNP
jgi:hypothetical protein